MESDCIFCQIVRGDQPADFLHKDDSLVVFRDIYPHAPVHLLIVPRKHVRSINKTLGTLAHSIDGSVLGRFMIGKMPEQPLFEEIHR